MILLVMGYVYFLAYCCLCLGCSVLCCVFAANVSEAQREKVVGAIPYANAIKTLNKKAFSNVDHENQDNMKSCAICLMDYEETDEIAELRCDQRHYFHSACLQDWLKKKLECPLCKRPVNQNEQ